MNTNDETHAPPLAQRAPSQAASQFHTETGVTIPEYATVAEAREARPAQAPSLDMNTTMPEKAAVDVLFSNSRDAFNPVTPGVTPHQPPYYYSNGAKALWWTIQDLIENDTCYFWLVTSPELVPDSWFGNMFRTFIRNMDNASQKGLLHPWWGGVRVFEPHPGGHGLHAHMVMRGRMPHSVVYDCARRAGLGWVFVDPNPCTILSAFYLGKYLNKKHELAGVRRWSCVGTYEHGIKVHDVVNSGTRIDQLKHWAGIYRVQGMHRYAAFRRAVQTVEDEQKESLLNSTF